MIQDALELGPSGRRKIGGDFFSYRPAAPRFIPRPVEEELRRDVRCPNCTLEHAVFGLATWCPDCGADVFCTHLDEELAVTRKMLAAVERRREELGARLAARDIENALEDTVSVFEAVLKALTRRRLHETGKSDEDVEQVLNRVIRNQYQNPAVAAEVLKAQVGIELFEGITDEDRDALTQTFAKRHPITHNLGIVDRKYLQRVQTGDLDGRDVRMGVAEVENAINISSTVLNAVHRRLFSGSAGDPASGS